MTQKKKIALILFFVFLFTFLQQGGSVYGSGTGGIVTGSLLNVRAGPSTNHAVIDQAAKGTAVDVLEQQSEWVRIGLSNGNEGWVFGEYLQIANQQSNNNSSSTTSNRKIHIIVDGRNVVSDADSFINSQNRTMVPVRFVGEELGYKVEWVSSERKVIIKNLDYEIILRAGQREAMVNGKPVVMDTQAELINERTMVPLRFISESIGAEVQWNASTSTVFIKTKTPEDSQTDGGKEDTETDDEKEDTQTYDSPKYALITGSVLNVRNGPGTHFQVIDQVIRGEFLEVLDENSGWYKIKTKNGAAGWSSGDYLEIQTGRSTADLPSRGTGRIVTVEGEEQNPPYHAITGLEYEEFDDGFFLTIKGNTSIRYDTMYLDNPQRIVIDLQGIKVDLDLNSGELVTNNSPYISKIRAGQFSDDVGRIVLDVKSSIGYQVLNRSGSSEITFVFQKNSLAGKTIVIDPGHGTVQSGTNGPGAVGPTGLIERDTVMDISNRLAAFLREQQAMVVLTRTGNSTSMTLQDRANLANSLNADLFVSVHADGSSNSSVMGSTTYFYAPANHAILGSQRAKRTRLAQFVQDSLVAHGGRPDRGIRESNFAVLRETIIPSTLVETAFITNPTEEALFKDPAFRARLSAGIAEGIIRYFNW